MISLSSRPMSLRPLPLPLKEDLLNSPIEAAIQCPQADLPNCRIADRRRRRARAALLPFLLIKLAALLPSLLIKLVALLLYLLMAVHLRNYPLTKAQAGLLRFRAARPPLLAVLPLFLAALLVHPYLLAVPHRNSLADLPVPQFQLAAGLLIEVRLVPLFFPTVLALVRLLPSLRMQRLLNQLIAPLPSPQA